MRSSPPPLLAERREPGGSAEANGAQRQPREGVAGADERGADVGEAAAAREDAAAAASEVGDRIHAEVARLTCDGMQRVRHVRGRGQGSTRARKRGARRRARWRAGKEAGGQRGRVRRSARCRFRQLGQHSARAATSTCRRCRGRRLREAADHDNEEQVARGRPQVNAGHRRQREVEAADHTRARCRTLASSSDSVAGDCCAASLRRRWRSGKAWVGLARFTAYEVHRSVDPRQRPWLAAAAAQNMRGAARRDTGILRMCARKTPRPRWGSRRPCSSLSRRTALGLWLCERCSVGANSFGKS